MPEAQVAREARGRGRPGRPTRPRGPSTHRCTARSSAAGGTQASRATSSRWAHSSSRAGVLELQRALVEGALSPSASPPRGARAARGPWCARCRGWCCRGRSGSPRTPAVTCWWVTPGWRAASPTNGERAVCDSIGPVRRMASATPRVGRIPRSGNCRASARPPSSSHSQVRHRQHGSQDPGHHRMESSRNVTTFQLPDGVLGMATRSGLVGLGRPPPRTGRRPAGRLVA